MYIVREKWPKAVPDPVFILIATIKMKIEKVFTLHEIKVESTNFKIILLP